MVRWLIVLMLLLFSCDNDSNPVTNEYRIGDNSMDEAPVPCCVYHQEI